MFTVLAKRPLLCVPMTSKSDQEHWLETTIYGLFSTRSIVTFAAVPNA